MTAINQPAAAISYILICALVFWWGIFPCSFMPSSSHALINYLYMPMVLAYGVLNCTEELRELNRHKHIV